MISPSLIVCLSLLTGSSQAPPAADEGVPADPFAGNACVQCHRNLPGRSSEIVDLEWKASVHHAANVGCEGCHGGNPRLRRESFESDEAWKVAAHVERDPEFLLVHRPKDQFVRTARGRTVSYFCGKCHADIKEKHLGSPHGAFGDPTCLYCHGQGSHRIVEPTLDVIDTRDRAEGGRCSPCHLASSMETVRRIKGTLLETEAEIEASGALYADLEAWGYRSLELEKLHHQAARVRSQLRQIFHSFNLQEINNFVGEINLTVERTEATYELISNLRGAQHRQTVVGGLAALMLLAFAGLLVYYRGAFLTHDD